MNNRPPVNPALLSVQGFAPAFFTVPQTIEADWPYPLLQNATTLNTFLISPQGVIYKEGFAVETRFIPLRTQLIFPLSIAYQAIHRLQPAILHTYSLGN